MYDDRATSADSRVKDDNNINLSYDNIVIINVRAAVRLDLYYNNILLLWREYTADTIRCGPVSRPRMRLYIVRRLRPVRPTRPWPKPCRRNAPSPHPLRPPPSRCSARTGRTNYVTELTARRRLLARTHYYVSLRSQNPIKNENLLTITGSFNDFKHVFILKL